MFFCIANYFGKLNELPNWKMKKTYIVNVCLQDNNV